MAEVIPETVSALATEIIARAVIRRDGQLLLARQLAEPSWWFLPGGHVEPGESVERALVREIAEELGTDARIHGLLGVVENRYSDGGGTHHELNLVFEVAVGDTELVSKEEHLEFCWLSLARVAAADVRPSALSDAILATGDDEVPFWRGS
jgi:8-oxo-dGTP diphosphatase